MSFNCSTCIPHYAFLTSGMCIRFDQSQIYAIKGTSGILGIYSQFESFARWGTHTPWGTRIISVAYVTNLW